MDFHNHHWGNFSNRILSLRALSRAINIFGKRAVCRSRTKSLCESLGLSIALGRTRPSSWVPSRTTVSFRSSFEGHILLAAARITITTAATETHGPMPRQPLRSANISQTACLANEPEEGIDGDEARRSRRTSN